MTMLMFAPDTFVCSDRGGLYAALKFRGMIARNSKRQSMSHADDCYDNAFMGSCFGTTKNELQMTAYESYRDASKELTEFIEYYNTSRLHSSLGYLSPIRFESTVPHKTKRTRGPRNPGHLKQRPRDRVGKIARQRAGDRIGHIAEDADGRTDAPNGKPQHTDIRTRKRTRAAAPRPNAQLGKAANRYRIHPTNAAGCGCEGVVWMAPVGVTSVLL